MSSGGSMVRDFVHKKLFCEPHFCPSCGSTGDVDVGVEIGKNRLRLYCEKCGLGHSANAYVPPRGCLQVIGEGVV